MVDAGDARPTGKDAQKKPLRFHEVSRALLLLGLNAALGGLIFGYDTGSMSGALIQVKRSSMDPLCPGVSPNPLTTQQQELVTSLVVLGAFLGSICASPLNDWIGRRGVLLVASVFFLVGDLCLSSSSSLGMMMGFRIVVGWGVGVASHTVPMYISECAPAELRGSLCFLNDLMCPLGQMTAAAVSTLFFYKGTYNGWRWMIGLAVIPSSMMFIGFLLMPESPRWLVSKQRHEEAKAVLYQLRAGTDPALIEAEYDVMLRGITATTPRRSRVNGFHDVLRLYIIDPRVRRALVLGCALQTLQQWGGINTIMYYGASVMQKAADHSAASCFDPLTRHNVAITILLGAAQLFGVIISWLLVDRLGRRPLMLISMGGVMLALTGIGIAFTPSHVVQLWVVLPMLVYLLFFGFGMSPVPWCVNAEIYPLHVRATCISVSCSTNWIMNFFVAQSFLSLSSSLSFDRQNPSAHPNGVFWLYALISLTGFVFLYRIMPETKGLTLEQIGRKFLESEEQLISAPLEDEEGCR